MRPTYPSKNHVDRLHIKPRGLSLHEAKRVYMPVWDRHAYKSCARVRLSDVFDFRTGYTPPRAQKELWLGGTVPWFRMNDIRQNGHILSDSIEHVTHDAVRGGLAPANSIIVSTSGTIGEHALITVPSWANEGFTYCILKPYWVPRIDPLYAYFWFFKVDEWCKRHVVGATIKHVNTREFGHIKFDVLFHEVQRRIGTALYRAEESLSNQQHGIAKLIEMAQQEYEQAVTTVFSKLKQAPDGAYTDDEGDEELDARVKDGQWTWSF